MYNAIIRPLMPQHTKEKLLVLGRDLSSLAVHLDAATLARLRQMTGGKEAAQADT